MKELILHRIVSGASGTFGMLLDGSTPLALTLEPENPTIPKGVFSVKRTFWEKHKRDYFEVVVQGHSGLFIHSGNTIRDTQGCIILGRSILTFGSDPVTHGIGQSTFCLENFMADYTRDFFLRVI